jgi:hypothetical protein
VTQNGAKGLSNEQPRGCLSCRFHSKQERRKALAVGDGDLELVEFDDEPQVVIVCQHESQPGKEQGLAESAPGAACALHERGGKKELSSELRRLMRRWES